MTRDAYPVRHKERHEPTERLADGVNRRKLLAGALAVLALNAMPKKASSQQMPHTITVEVTIQHTGDELSPPQAEEVAAEAAQAAANKVSALGGEVITSDGVIIHG